MPSIHKLIRTNRSKLIHRARQASHEGQLEHKADAEMRVSYLNDLERRLRSETRVAERPSIFVSYATQKGARYYDAVVAKAHEYSFNVDNGFIRKREANVLNAVRTAIAESAVFLAIMTPELRIGPRQYAPSIWVVEEKGMALALGKPFRLLVHNSVHRDYWQRTTPGALHHIFDDDFDEQLDHALAALQRRYEELQMASLYAPHL